jgi:hypothetical protein
MTTNTTNNSTVSEYETRFKEAIPQLVQLASYGSPIDLLGEDGAKQLVANFFNGLSKETEATLLQGSVTDWPVAEMNRYVRMILSGKLTENDLLAFAKMSTEPPNA